MVWISILYTLLITLFLPLDVLQQSFTHAKHLQSAILTVTPSLQQSRTAREEVAIDR